MSGILALKSDLHDFLEQKREQLRLLSQSLDACTVVQQAGVSVSVDALIQTPSGNTPEIGKPAGQQLPPAGVSPMPAVAVPGDVSPLESQTDPLLRLTAIKMRLAKQIENQ